MARFPIRLHLLLSFILSGVQALAASTGSGQAASEKPAWKLVWHDEFSGAKINSRYWSPCVRTKSDWANTKSTDPSLFELRRGTLRLRGIQNHNRNQDPAPYLTAGITTKGKYSFTYGKVRIRARFKSAQGAWPALWMMGEEGRWPANGEIDLMEHLNFDRKIYQTVHSPYTQNTSKTNPRSGFTSPVKPNAWNTYGCEWSPDKITFTVNGKPTHHYPRLPEKGADQWPFKQPFYFILSMQIGGNWVNSKKNGGPTKPEHYPSWLEVDWIRVYQKTKP